MPTKTIALARRMPIGERDADMRRRQKPADRVTAMSGGGANLRCGHRARVRSRAGALRTVPAHPIEENVLIYITVKKKLKPGTADAYLAASQTYTDATRAEPGNKFYEHYRSVDDPDTILTIEAFDDAAAGEAHVNSEHFQQGVDGSAKQYIAERPDILYIDLPDRDGWTRCRSSEPTPALAARHGAAPRTIGCGRGAERRREPGTVHLTCPWHAERASGIGSRTAAGVAVASCGEPAVGVGRCPMLESAASRGSTGPTPWRCAMSALLVGYARCSTDQQDLTAQRDALLALGVEAERIYVDHGLTGTNRERPGLREALAACRAGDTLVVTKLDRLARSLPDARAIADELTTRQISLSLGGSVYDPTDAVGRLLFNVLAMVAEFESDLIRLRTREGMKVAKAKGRLRGKQPKLNRRQEAHLVSLVHSGEYSTARGRRALRRRPLHRLPRHRTPTHRCQSRSRGGSTKR